DRTEIRRRVRSDDFRCNRLEVHAIAEVKQPLEPAAAIREGTLLLQLNLRVLELTFERLVLDADPSERHVVAPRATDPARDGEGGTLNLGVRAEGDCLQNR